jgi:O-antigen ligase
MLQNNNTVQPSPPARDPHPSNGLSVVTSRFLWASVLCAIAAAAPAYLPFGIFPNVDVPMALLGLSTIFMSFAALTHAGAANTLGRTSGLMVVGLGAVTVVSLAFSGSIPLSIFGHPATRLGVISVMPALGLMLLARGFAGEVGRMLRLVAPYVVGAWAMTMAGQAALGLPLQWGLSSNGAITAQVFLLLLPALVARGARRAWVRLLVGLAVTGLLWIADSRLGVGLAVAWLLSDRLLQTGVVKSIPRRVLLGIPVAHLLVSIGLLVAFSSSGLATPAPLTSRPWIWRAGMDLMAESPFTGAGPGMFASAVTHVVSPTSAFMEADWPHYSASAHMFWLEIGTEYGLIGVVAVLAGALLLASRWSTSMRSRGIVFVAGLCLFSVTLLLQPLSLQTVPLLMLMIAASMPLSAGRGVASGRPMPLVALATALVLFAYSGTVLVIGEPENRPASSSSTEVAARFWRYDPELWLQTSFRYAQELSGGRDRVAAAEAVDAALARAVQLAPREYRYSLNLAQASEALGADVGLVRARYEDALAAFPLSPLVNHAYGLFLARQGDSAGAVRAYGVLNTYYPQWSGIAGYRAQCERLGVQLP